MFTGAHCVPGATPITCYGHSASDWQGREVKPGQVLQHHGKGRLECGFPTAKAQKVLDSGARPSSAHPGLLSPEAAWWRSGPGS